MGQPSDSLLANEVKVQVTGWSFWKPKRPSQLELPFSALCPFSSSCLKCGLDGWGREVFPRVTATVLLCGRWRPGSDNIMEVATQP